MESIQQSSGRDSASPLPWSRMPKHEMRNPFTLYESNCKQDVPCTPKSVIKGEKKLLKNSTLSKLCKTQSVRDVLTEQATMPARKIEDNTNATLTEEETKAAAEKKPEKHATKNISGTDVKVVPATKLSSIRAYQRLLTQELINNFNVFSAIELPSEAELDKHRFHILRTHKESLKIALFLDLDETLAYIVRDSRQLSDKAKREARKVEVLNNGEMLVLSYLPRPHLAAFLEMLSPHYDISIFTASECNYASALLDCIDPDRLYIKRIMHRDHCILRQGKYLKDLRCIKNIKMERAIIVDNLVVSFAAHIENGIYVPMYTGQENDNQLEIVAKFLLQIYDVEDVRPYVKKFAGIAELYKEYCECNMQLN